MKKFILTLLLLFSAIVSYLLFCNHSIPEEKQITRKNLQSKLQQKPYTHLLFVTSWCEGKTSHFNLYQEYLKVLPKDSITFIVLAADSNFEVQELDKLKLNGFETTYINKLNAFPLLDKYNVRTFVKDLNVPFDKDVDFNSSPIDLLYDRNANVFIKEPLEKLFLLNKKNAN